MAYINGKKVLFAPKVTIKKIEVKKGVETTQTKNFKYFAAYNRFPEQELEYIDTANGTDFSSMFSESDTITEVPDLETGNGTLFQYMFNNCKNLNKAPNIDVSQGTNFSSMFKECQKITEVPDLETGNGTNFSQMFYNCRKLNSVGNLDLSNGTNFGSMFYYCYALKSIGVLDTSKGTDFSDMFVNCSQLHTIEGIDLTNATKTSRLFSVSSLKNITFNGVIKINNLSLGSCYNLTAESLVSAFNALEDKASDTSGTTWNITIGSSNKARLTEDQLAIALNKGWVVN